RKGSSRTVGGNPTLPRFADGRVKIAGHGPGHVGSRRTRTDDDSTKTGGADMKRTIIAAAVCGITLSAVACAPSDSADGTDSSAVASVADSTSRPSHTDESGSSTSATSQTPSESTSAETTASAMPASPTTTADQGAA